MMDRAARKSAKSLYYHKTKTNRLYKVPPVAARRALYDQIYKKDEQGRYIIDGRPSCHSQSESVSSSSSCLKGAFAASIGGIGKRSGASAHGFSTTSKPMPAPP